MRLRAVMQPVSGTFELRWQWYRGDTPPPGGREANGEPSAVSLDGAAPARAPQAKRAEPAIAGRRRRIDEGSPGT
jgi:hypothetical protein